MDERVLELLREAGERFVRPRFRALADGEVTEKSPGEVVTVADREAEVFLAAGLGLLRPGLPVVGEEAVAADPSVLDVLYPEGSCWLVDPVDGTNNFVSGDPSYGMAVALVEGGRAVASWIWQPEFGVAWEAELKAGTFRNGERMTVSARATTLPELRGVFHTRFFPPEQREAVEGQPVEYVRTPGALTSACDYPALIEGAVDFICWGRILPWDHAPGTLLLTEAGGVNRRLDGSAYEANAVGDGTLAAASSEVWELARGTWPF
ncbi:inositol monophosphatase family protein [Kribbella sp. NPDC005582]|uniref:inositol monophosphatase family protein n=1 Tax=Kribbella sp. NPDC005582 TaxID=3156893 RepID=UPI0033B1A12F